MKNQHRVRIKTTSPTTADVFIDDKKIENCREFKFEHTAGNCAELTMYAFDDTEIEEDAVVIVDKTPRWTPVSEGKPTDREWYLGIFREPDTGWVNPIPFVCDYVGKETKATTKEFWILRGLTDVDNPADYYKNLECVKWMPLPDSEVE